MTDSETINKRFEGWWPCCATVLAPFFGTAMLGVCRTIALAAYTAGRMDERWARVGEVST